MGKGAMVGGGSVVIALVLALLGAPQEVVQQVLRGGGQTAGEGTTEPADPAQEPTKDMMRVVLADTEDVWRKLMPGYKDPQLSFFGGGVESACGFASSAVGPFYCPMDRNVYLDVTFFEELEKRFGAPGVFAQAYVLAHEVGHHVQTLTGVSEKVHARRQRASESEGNALSVRQELQADCYAGVWAHHTARMKTKRIEPGDIESGLGAASAIGDDNLQKRARGYVVPESFTHGTGAQRVQWFKRGFESGQPNDCDTFSARSI
jgi:predicted metalloprotease